MTSELTPAEEADAADRRAMRNAAKLGALVRDRWGLAGAPDPMGTGAALAVDGRAFVLVEGSHALGAALAWARGQDARELHVLVDEADAAGALARQAAEFRTAIEVLLVDGRELRAAEPASLDPGVGPPDAPELVALLVAAGLEVVVEGDRLGGEFRGLEIARIVRAVDDGEPILEVGVGQYDRTLTALMHGELDARDSIGRVVDQLREIRCPGGPNHPLATLVPERWLRSTILRDPGLVGCDTLAAAPTATPRDRLRPRGVAAATGTRRGRPVVVVCSVGVDLEAPVQAADTRLALDPDAVLLFVAPGRDLLPATRAMVEDLRRPAEVVAFDGDWRQ